MAAEARYLLALSALLLALVLAGCTPGPQPAGQLPLPTPGMNEWKPIPMTGGTTVWSACVRHGISGVRLFYVNKLEWQSEPEPRAGGTLTSQAGC